MDLSRRKSVGAILRVFKISLYQTQIIIQSRGVSFHKHGGDLRNTVKTAVLLWYEGYKPEQIPRKTADGSSFPAQAARPPHRSFWSSSHKPFEATNDHVTHTFAQVEVYSDRDQWGNGRSTLEFSSGQHVPRRAGLPSLPYDLLICFVASELWPFIAWKECVHVKK